MISYCEGNLFESEAQALVNTVNTVGVMGKGIALQFKMYFPNNFHTYANACKNGQLRTGQLLVTEEQSIGTGPKMIINFPTKEHWRQPSQYAYIEAGLEQLRSLILQRKIQSVALPPLGAGNGGLQWSRVQQLIEQYLQHIDCNILVYLPNAHVKERLKQELPKLTPARAMLLALLYDLVSNGEFVSEFAAEKLAYFLQRFGAQPLLKLEFKPYFYGPYSGKVKHVLHHLNGSYLMGYHDKDAKPFDFIQLNTDTQQHVLHYLQQANNLAYWNIVQKTSDFLQGYYAYYTLELLSTVDFIVQQHQTHDTQTVLHALRTWNERKSALFAKEQFVQMAIDKVKTIDQCPHPA